MSTLHALAGGENHSRLADVLFVHGLSGDAFATWRHGHDATTSFPHWLGEDFPAVGIWSLDYAASATKWTRALSWRGADKSDAGQSMALPDRAAQVLDLISLEGLGQRPLLFVCHSLGGLLTKQLLRKAKESLKPRERAVFANARGVLFLATPHAGASLASLANLFRAVLLPTASMDDLREHDAQLRDLLNWYRNHTAAAGISTVTYFEMRDVSGVRIVNETSSHPAVGADPIGLDEDHLSIAKPRDRRAQVYKAACELLRAIASTEAVPASVAPAATATAARADDWDFQPAAALIGLTKSGPLQMSHEAGDPIPVTSWAEFSAVFGDDSPLVLADGSTRPCLAASSAKAFFEHGGGTLQVVRHFSAASDSDDDGVACCQIADVDVTAMWQARWRGSAGNVTVEITAEPQPAVLYRPAGSDELQVRGAAHGEVIEVRAPHSLRCVVQIAAGKPSYLDGDGRAVVFRDDATVNRLRMNLTVTSDGRTLQRLSGLSTCANDPDFVVTSLSSDPGQRFMPSEAAALQLQRWPLVSLAWEPRDALSPMHLLTALIGRHVLSGGHDGAAPNAIDLTRTLALCESIFTAPELEFVAVPDACACRDRAESLLAIASIAKLAATDGGPVFMLDAPPDVSAEELINLKDLIGSANAAIFLPWLAYARSASPAGEDTALLPPSAVMLAAHCHSRALLPSTEAAVAGSRQTPAHGYVLIHGPHEPGLEHLTEDGLNFVQLQDGACAIGADERLMNGYLMRSPQRLMRHVARCVTRHLLRDGVLFEARTPTVLARVQSEIRTWIDAFAEQRGFVTTAGAISVACSQAEGDDDMRIDIGMTFPNGELHNICFRAGLPC